MAIPATGTPAHPRPLRLWPGVLILALLWAVWFVGPLVGNDQVALFSLLGAGFLTPLLVIAWWAFFSRARAVERWGAPLLMVLALAATFPFLHRSFAELGMGMFYLLYAPPVLSLAFVVWAVATRRLPDRTRVATMVAVILVACAGWTLVRADGIRGDSTVDLAWRWSPTPEQQLLAEVAELPAPPPAAPLAAEPEPPPAVPADEVPATPVPDAAAPEPAEAAVAGGAPGPPPAKAAEWPGFRGPSRDSVIRGVRIATDWSASPPVELWRRPIGPGWSSFAVQGDRVYTQEQRGEEEVVACYDAATGDMVWAHAYPARFWEANGGAGPRATPTLHDGRVYSFGATGMLHALDADTGRVLWSRDATKDTGKQVPYWGLSSSPLVFENLVIVHAGALSAYDLATGEPRWTSEAGGGSYSSPHLATIDGVPQILLLGGARIAGVAPADGTRLWEHQWDGTGIIQPAVIENGDVLIGAGGAGSGSGVRRLSVSQTANGWTAEERWTSIGLKPYFNDFVVHEGHAFGFDGRILAGIDLADGERVWKGGRYGHGQLVLLPEQDVLLVVTEDGDIALVRAAPDRFEELAKVSALEGKTWNHPVLVRDMLLVRNGQEMVAFRMPLAAR